MATFIPAVQDPTTESPAEVEFYHHLKRALPDEYRVFHSVPYLVGPDRGHRPALEGEIDFLIAHPEHGLLAVEVKGGGVSLEGRQWYSQGKRGVAEIQDPFRQAQRGIKELVNLIYNRGALDADETFTHGHAVAFPQCKFKNGVMPSDGDRAVLIDLGDLDQLKERIERIFSFWKKHRSHRPLTTKGLKKITQRVLAPTFRLVQSLSGRLRWEDECLLRLTTEQSCCLDFLGRNPCAAIEGAAGTGKTIVALDYARALVESGRKVLLLCFNRLLGAQLRRRAQAYDPELIWAGHFHALCEELAAKAGLDVTPPEQDSSEYEDYWNLKLPLLLLEAVEKVPDRFDAILVDEAQDFEPDWWSTLDALWKDADQRRLALFSDPLQNIYGRPEGLPENYPVLPLSTNCRNTREIAEYFSGLVNARTHQSSWSVPGEEPKVYRCADKRETRVRIEKIVEELLKQELKPEQITLLSTHRLVNSSVAGIKDVAGVPLDVLEDSRSEPSPGRIGFSTLHRFKGLDSDVVIFIDVDGSASATPRHQYVAASRAKHRLYVVHVD